jgi:hypothetical protein
MVLRTDKQNSWFAILASGTFIPKLGIADIHTDRYVGLGREAQLKTTEPKQACKDINNHSFNWKGFVIFCQDCQLCQQVSGSGNDSDFGDKYSDSAFILHTFSCRLL